ncbi:MAG: response regulator transcription factor [Gammaproteobacteria bacterium]|nr:response regulator transcription factor [Gammaproteobacteria bacterium]
MRFLLIDDHKLFLDGLEYVLDRLHGTPEITRTHSALEALDWLRQGQAYDLVLLDLNMPDISGLSFMATMNEQAIIAPTAIISATEDINLIQQVLDAGALGFISKSSSSEELLTAIETMLKGELYVPSWYKEYNHYQNTTHGVNDTIRNLGITPRQLQVLQFMAKGNSNKQIAAFLNLSEATIKSHISAIFKLLDTRNRTECINIAQRRGIIDHSS